MSKEREQSEWEAEMKRMTEGPKVNLAEDEHLKGYGRVRKAVKNS